MKTGKIMLIIVAATLALFAAFLFFRLKAQSKLFEDLKVSYQGQDAVYDDLEVDTTIVNINNVSFMVISKTNDTVVLSTVEALYNEDGEDIGTEHQVKMNKYTTVCFAAKDCAYLTLE